MPKGSKTSPISPNRLGVTPYRLAGRSPPPSRLWLTRICLRCAIHGSAGQIRRLNGRGIPEPPRLEARGVSREEYASCFATGASPRLTPRAFVEEASGSPCPARRRICPAEPSSREHPASCRCSLGGPPPAGVNPGHAAHVRLGARGPEPGRLPEIPCYSAPVRNVSSCFDRTGCWSFFTALASIWRTRSRVTRKMRPTSSSV